MLKRRCTQRGDAAGTSYSAFLVSCSAWTIHPCRVSHSGENSIRAECCDLPGGGGEEEVGRKNWACSNADASVKRSFVVHRRRRLHTHTHTRNYHYSSWAGPRRAGGGSRSQDSVYTGFKERVFCLKKSSLLALQSRWEWDHRPPVSHPVHIGRTPLC